MSSVYPIDNLQMVIGLVPITAVIAISAYYRLGLTRTMIIAVIRASVQLGIMGYVLSWVFKQDNPFFIICLLILMIGVAAQAGLGRIKGLAPGKVRNIHRFILFVSICISSVLTGAWMQLAVIQPTPFWEGMYIIPIAGMLINQAMNASSLALERFRSELESHTAMIEELLALGANQRQAVHEVGKKAISAALVPTINGMMVLGIVALPGMMSGQILSGVEPTLAVRYQLLIYFSIVATNGIAAFLAVEMTRKQYFTKDDQFVFSRSEQKAG